MNNFYAQRKRRDKECNVGEHVFLRIKPNKSTLRVGLYGKIAPSYVGPFEILAKTGNVVQ